ncbi:MAG: acyltransferase [Synechococcales bacterium]|nr:acyltransferase [Synechococcales bacterium]
MTSSLFTAPSQTAQHAKQQILNQVKKISWWRSLLPLYYWLQGNRRRLKGKGNVVQIDTDGYLPFLKQVTITVKGDRNTVKIQAGVHLRSTSILINGSDNVIHIGEQCQMQGGCLWIADNRCSLEIGKGTTIAKALIGVAEPEASVSIGEDCMLSHGIDIRCGDSHSILDLTTQKRINYAHRIQIDAHVWLGMQSSVLKNVHIGKGAIIAGGSIVTKDIPAHCLAAGIPAAVKRTKVTWAREKIPAS